MYGLWDTDYIRTRITPGIEAAVAAQNARLRSVSDLDDDPIKVEEVTEDDLDGATCWTAKSEQEATEMMTEWVDASIPPS